MGPDREALRRLEGHFPMPAKPMGEAWFMGERSLYTDLLDKDASRWSQGVIESAVNCLASGPGCLQRIDQVALPIDLRFLVQRVLVDLYAR